MAPVTRVNSSEWDCPRRLLFAHGSMNTFAREALPLNWAPRSQGQCVRSIYMPIRAGEAAKTALVSVFVFLAAARPGATLLASRSFRRLFQSTLAFSSLFFHRTVPPSTQGSGAMSFPMRPARSGSVPERPDTAFFFAEIGPVQW
ncbi:hypothetical protein Purlil1_13677 [Purpureocillium lilacinum]|uniref:Uncharacterized protein n=1 Tax=Purpureocillium lilacinum TaxID=33203 RepID=A0ABR0BDD0_PURLI|nr:hypothetical protein Purlil1_13677 [Purpureocillium lilacinum]